MQNYRQKHAIYRRRDTYRIQLYSEVNCTCKSYSVTAFCYSVIYWIRATLFFGCHVTYGL